MKLYSRWFTGIQKIPWSSCLWRTFYRWRTVLHGERKSVVMRGLFPVTMKGILLSFMSNRWFVIVSCLVQRFYDHDGKFYGGASSLAIVDGLFRTSSFFPLTSYRLHRHRISTKWSCYYIFIINKILSTERRSTNGSKFHSDGIFIENLSQFNLNIFLCISLVKWYWLKQWCFISLSYPNQFNQ